MFEITVSKVGGNAIEWEKERTTVVVKLTSSRSPGHGSSRVRVSNKLQHCLILINSVIVYRDNVAAENEVFIRRRIRKVGGCKLLEIVASI